MCFFLESSHFARRQFLETSAWGLLIRNRRFHLIRKKHRIAKVSVRVGDVLKQGRYEPQRVRSLEKGWGGKDETWNPLSLWRWVWLVIPCVVQRAIIYAIRRERKLIEIVYYKNWRKQIGAFICVPILGSIHCDFMVAETDLAYSFIQRRLVQRDPGATPSNQSLPLLTKCQSFVPFCLLFSDWNLDDFAHIAFLEQQQTAPQCWAKRTKIAQLWEVLFLIGQICWWMIHIVMFSVSFLGAHVIYIGLL